MELAVRPLEWEKRKMRLSPVFAAAAFALLIVPMQASSARQQESKPDSDRQKLICKSSPSTGSRLRRERTCLTRDQWDQRAQEAQRNHTSEIGNMPTPKGN